MDVWCNGQKIETAVSVFADSSGVCLTLEHPQYHGGGGYICIHLYRNYGTICTSRKCLSLGSCTWCECVALHIHVADITVILLALLLEAGVSLP